MLDAKGQELAEGDTVMVPFKIVRLIAGNGTVFLETVLKTKDGNREHLQANAETMIKG